MAAALRRRPHPARGRKSPVGDAWTSAAEAEGSQDRSRRRPTSRSRCSSGARRRRARISHLPLPRDRRLSAGLQLPQTAALRLCAGGRRWRPKAAYLQRARFVAIAEFGPRSLIYHEGRAYRVTKAKLPPNIRAEDGGGGSQPTRSMSATV